jgi:hypothetical protein
MLERERQNDAGASVCLSGCSLQRWIDGCIDRCLANSLLLVVEREGERGFLVVNYLVALLLERERRGELVAKEGARTYDDAAEQASVKK